ncbi:MAG: TerB family tellurite resistance protein [Planctomycetes bacterium]|nr:TerB family tellurite resistance protein [Planctomycetota bacterium]
MADWRKLAIALTLADGKIDDEEVKILKKELWADGKIDKEEVKFLIELRNAAQKKAKARKAELNAGFERLFFKAIEENVLADGKIDAGEARWLKDMLFADRKIDANEKKFLVRIKKAAKQTSPEFDALYNQCMKTK